MKTIIAGSRWVAQATFDEAMVACPWTGEITLVLCGCAKGPDTFGARWAKAKKLPVEYYPPYWCERGFFNPKAGIVRNEQMSRVGEALIAIWDRASKGTKDMIQRAEKKGFRVFVYDVIARKELVRGR